MIKNPAFDKFVGTNQYIASSSLRNAVNVSIALKRPLLVKGEPGNGKNLAGPQHCLRIEQEPAHMEYQINH